MLMTRNLLCSVVVLALAPLAGADLQNIPHFRLGAEVASVEKIWDQGEHNAFTDLIRFNDTWYCTFREGENHVGTDGLIRIIRSADGTTWESCGLLEEAGIDLRDPKLSLTPDNRLMLNMGGSTYDGDTLLNRRPRVSFSSDGTTWSAPEKICADGDWLWRVTWHAGQAWGVSYDNRIGHDGREWELRLYVSDDGVHYRIRTILDVPDRPNETTLRFDEHGNMLALVRREAGDKGAYLGFSVAPYVDWQWTNTDVQMGGPNFLQLPSGHWIAAGRRYPGGAKTVLYELAKYQGKVSDHGSINDEDFHPALLTKLGTLAELPSGGDTSYPGLVWHDGMLWMTYYASHEGKTSIYLAHIKVWEAASTAGK